MEWRGDCQVLVEGKKRDGVVVVGVVVGVGAAVLSIFYVLICHVFLVADMTRLLYDEDWKKGPQNQQKRLPWFGCNIFIIVQCRTPLYICYIGKFVIECFRFIA